MGKAACFESCAIAVLGEGHRMLNIGRLGMTSLMTFQILDRSAS